MDLRGAALVAHDQAGDRRARRSARAAPFGAHRLLLPDARLGLRGRGRRAGDDSSGRGARYDGFEGRAALRSWLYRIATNVCLDMLNGRERRARPWTSARRRAPKPGIWRRCRRTPGSSPIADEPRRARRTAIPAEVGCRAGDDPARVRRRAPAPAGPPARRADPARGAALEGGRGGRAARHQRAVGQQRAAAGARDARADVDADEQAADRRRRRARSCSPAMSTRSSATTSTRCVALLHEDATQSMPPYSLWLQRPRRHPPVVVGPGAGVAAPASSRPCPRTGRRRSASGSPVSRARAPIPGPSRCSSSQPGASSSSPSSSTRDRLPAVRVPLRFSRSRTLPREP